MKNRFATGDHNVISDISGQKFKRSEMTIDWRGLMVHRATEFSPKHPQIDIRGRTERIGVTNGTRTQSEDPPLQDPPFNPAGMV